MEAGMTAKGPYTGVRLSDVSTLFQQTGSAAEGAPNCSQRTLRLSYELAAAAYTMDQDNWAEAGWRDFSMLINRTLLTGAMLNSTGSAITDLTRSTLQTLAKLKMSALNPVEQILGLRQSEEETNSLKAIVMLMPQDGLMIVGISFMGTGKQLGDWTANLRMDVQDGLHAGFLQLTQEFVSRTGQIQFPYAASELKLGRLTLADIIEAMKKPDCRFRLWVCGHSQGGAVMQVFIDQLLREGVRREYLSGIGFASPSVAHPGRPLPEGGYPITHILNEDDLVPRLGAWQHMGEYLVFTPSEYDRRQMYGSAVEDPCHREAHDLLMRAQTAPEALLNGLAILRVLHMQSETSLRRVLGEPDQSPLADLLNVGEDSIIRFLDNVDNLTERLEHGYIAVSGEDCVPPMTSLTAEWNMLLSLYGLSAWIRAIKDACLLPHRLYRITADEFPAYRYIVNEGLDRLQHRMTLNRQPTAETATQPAFPGRPAGHTYRPRPAPKLVLPTPNSAPKLKMPVTPAPSQPAGLPSKALNRLSRYATVIRLLAASRTKK